MHNFVYLAQRCSQEFFCVPNFGGRARPLAAPLLPVTGPKFPTLALTFLIMKVASAIAVSRYDGHHHGGHVLESFCSHLSFCVQGFL